MSVALHVRIPRIAIIASPAAARRTEIAEILAGHHAGPPSRRRSQKAGVGDALHDALAVLVARARIAEISARAARPRPLRPTRR